MYGMDDMKEYREAIEENGNKLGRKKMVALVLIILVLTIAIPLSFFSLFLRDEGESRYYFTFKEFHDKYDSLDLKDGDIVYIKDVFSGIWYNEDAHYTYLAFESMDGYRTDPWEYDAGYPRNITGDYREGDEVILKIEMNQEMVDGKPNLVGHITSIEHVK
ncbi:MAG: hypothetical protein JSW00_16045 [Thermoplasmata archaeon]|nr:MAG: hypothetical protein JSW00_16045 [Thermoplasmata archaeon]